jgi:AcrR family transcriptional regulator
MPARPPSARPEGKSRRRDEIVAAARRLMRDSGDLGFSMRSLAENARVSIATPYNVFGSKQAVLLAVLDADLAEYELALGALQGNGIDVLFEAIALMHGLVARDPGFYRGVLVAVLRDGGPEFRHMVSGPRYLLWKKLLKRATDAGFLQDDADPDAFAIAVSQVLFSNILEWAHGTLSLDELKARSRYGLALALLALATPTSRSRLQQELRAAEQSLQRMWRSALARRLRDGPLDDESRELFADQLRHVPEHTIPEVSL